ncbi:PspC domain-containing protein [Gordonia neofelifaecis]|uniref:Phage shock protein C, PspC n=1 Tax=Gordonia neofelifaecis NRRL B-59395 TaxID=644548 RepID=F1YEX5_9ACTN|nr:PspC domain-containing protein [Gordonia neofelifaecis]EGD56958.1 phage shock protein C, PspC [Gordonia neofelifaecis NRRL B-59395]
MTDPSIPGADGAYNPEPSRPSRRLTRSSSDKMLGGVAGGIAEYFGVDSTWVRVAFVASIILPGPQVLLYLLLWIIIPKS